MQTKSLIKAINNQWDNLVNHEMLKWKNLSIQQKEYIIKKFDNHIDIYYCELKLKLALILVSMR